jgi:hypothetical protein
MIMAAFKFSLTACRLREYAAGVKGEYFGYLRKNKITLDDEENLYVKNFFELEEIRTKRTDNCQTEEEATVLMNRIDELRKFIDEVK